MMIDSTQIISMTEANQNFSKVARQCEKQGCVVIFKNNKPKYVLMDVDTMEVKLPATDENLDAAAKKELERAQWL